jgi:hypothetical protein
LNKSEREMEGAETAKRCMFLPPAKEIEGTLPVGIYRVEQKYQIIAVTS